MSTSLDGVQVAGPWTTMLAPYSGRINLDVLGGSVFFQLGRGNPPYFDDQPEERQRPGVYSFTRHFDAVRVRAVDAGAPATVHLLATHITEFGNG